MAISCAVGLSLVVSFTMIPTAAARLFATEDAVGAPARPGSSDGQECPSYEVANGHLANGKRKTTAQNSADLVTQAMQRFGSGFANSIAQFNRWLLSSRTRCVSLVLVMVCLSFGISFILWPKVEYLPSGNRNFVFCSLSTPPGYNMNQLEAMGEKFESDLEPYWNVDPNSPEAQQLEYPPISYYFFAVRGTSVFVGSEAADPTRTRELIPLMREKGGQFPGTRALAKQSSLFERGFTSGRTIDVEITGGDLEKLIDVGRRVLGDVKRLIPDAQAMPRPSLDLSSPEIHVEPKLFESFEMGISSSELGYTVDAFVDGAYAGDYFVDGDKIDLTIIGKDATRRPHAGPRNAAGRDAFGRSRPVVCFGRCRIQQRAASDPPPRESSSDHDFRNAADQDAVRTSHAVDRRWHRHQIA